MNNLARLVIREVHIAELHLILEACKLLRIRGIGDKISIVENCEDALSRSNSLVDICELIDKCTHRACNLREGGYKGYKSCTAQRATHYERTSEHQYNRYGRNSEELAHRRSQLLAASHPEQCIGQVLIQGVELILDIIGCSVGLDDLNSAERLIKHTHQIAHTLLTLTCRMAQLLDDATDNKAYKWQEQHREECQLPRDAEHQNQVTDNKERLTECHLQSVSYAVLHDHHIRSDTRDNIALALTAEITYILAYYAVEHRVAHTLHGSYSHILDRISAKIAEEIR